MIDLKKFGQYIFTFHHAQFLYQTLSEYTNSVYSETKKLYNTGISLRYNSIIFILSYGEEIMEIRNYRKTTPVIDAVTRPHYAF